MLRVNATDMCYGGMVIHDMQCARQTEIQTIEGGQKKMFSLGGPTLRKKTVFQ